MANVWAIKTGNWSDPTVWNTGVLPTSGDDVYANNFTVSVNQNIDVVSLRNSGATGITIGGTFTFNTSGVTANISNNIFCSYTGTFVSITASTGTVIINIPNGVLLANIFGATFISHTGNCNLTLNAVSIKGVNADVIVLTKSSLGLLTINANIDPTGYSVAKSISLTSNSTTIINGNIVGSAVTEARALIITNGDVTINGNITGGSSSTAGQGAVGMTGGVLSVTGTIQGTNSSGIFASGGTINVTGNILGTNSNGIAGIVISGSAILNHIGTAQASAYASAIACNTPITSSVTCTGPFLKNGNVVAIASQILRINFNSNSYFQFKKSNGEDIDYVSTIEGYNYPTASDVRNGVVYKSGLVTGTLKVPSPGDVRKNIPTDNTVGTADLTAEDFIAGLETSTKDIAKRLRNCATVESTGAQLEAY